MQNNRGFGGEIYDGRSGSPIRRFYRIQIEIVDDFGCEIEGKNLKMTPIFIQIVIF